MGLTGIKINQKRGDWTVVMDVLLRTVSNGRCRLLSGDPPMVMLTKFRQPLHCPRCGMDFRGVGPNENESPPIPDVELVAHPKTGELIWERVDTISEMMQPTAKKEKRNGRND